jgi:Uncharacterized conserved protein
MDQINKRVEIKANREAYKSLGKDPNRYRPSAESLCRRIVKEKSLYKINTIVDLINLISIKYGYSIGGFDEDKISGDHLTLTVGKTDDIFNGIGRGILNIENLPVFKDSVGGIGTPTSDEERTKLAIDTTHLLIIINGYDGGLRLKEAAEEFVFYLRNTPTARILKCHILTENLSFNLLPKKIDISITFLLGNQLLGN